MSGGDTVDGSTGQYSQVIDKHRTIHWLSPEFAGLPPLARGRRVRDRTGHGEGRLTPARAGKTGSPRSPSPPTTAHPRSRGEDRTGAHWSPGPHGSPPLARGRPADSRAMSGGLRLTPARAGKTRRRCTTPAVWTAHPRLRGEDIHEYVCTLNVHGSPPLARGRRPQRPRTQSPRRLTPARAGKTSSGPPRTRGGTAHPRSRGEDTTFTPRRTAAAGSPPLARGRLRTGVAAFGFGRLTPARAGKTGPARTAARPRTAHPRSRGEDAPRDGYEPPYPGTPPLARGRPRGGRRAPALRRLTPARAGMTCPAAARTGHAAAHPRSRGEDRVWGDGPPLSVGSPPLARGRRVRQRHVPDTLRLTPARAGKT